LPAWPRGTRDRAAPAGRLLRRRARRRGQARPASAKALLVSESRIRRRCRECCARPRAGDAATTRTAINAAAKRVMPAKAKLKQLEIGRTAKPQRNSSRNLRLASSCHRTDGLEGTPDKATVGGQAQTNHDHGGYCPWQRQPPSRFGNRTCAGLRETGRDSGANGYLRTGSSPGRRPIRCCTREHVEP
jgi:hypothetical protein